MHIYYEPTYIKNSSLALGFFDAVHSGHEVILKNSVRYAKENNTVSTVITFEKHPSFYLKENIIPQIITNEEKITMFERIGIDNVVFLDFSCICSMSAEDYIKNIPVKYFSPVAVTTGFNHRFGYNAEGNGNLLKNLQEKYGYKYFEVPPYVVDGETVSCSLIRNKLLSGDIYNADRLLGYDFFISGIVVEGEHIASKLGYPSANIIYPDDKIRLPYGVYYVIVEINGNKYDGVLNFGFGHTTGNDLQEKTEVHIIDFNENIYGKNIKISFVTKIRNQSDFENVEKLKEQIQRDVAFTKIYGKFKDSKINLTCKKMF